MTYRVVDLLFDAWNSHSKILLEINDICSKNISVREKIDLIYKDLDKEDEEPIFKTYTRDQYIEFWVSGNLNSKEFEIKIKLFGGDNLEVEIYNIDSRPPKIKFCVSLSHLIEKDIILLFLADSDNILKKRFDQ